MFLLYYAYYYSYTGKVCIAEDMLPILGGQYATVYSRTLLDTFP